MADTPTHTGAMVALFPHPDLAQAIAQPGGEPPDELHITLAFLGKAADIENPQAVHDAVKAWAADQPPFTGHISGTGQFTNGDEHVTYARPDLPGIHDARARLAQHLAEAGTPASTKHAFTPHMTLAYDHRQPDLPAHPLQFDHVTVGMGDERSHYPLKGAPVAKADEISNAPWNGSPAHFSDDQWKASCVLDRGGTVASIKARYGLPVREPDGTLNRKGMAAAQGTLNGSRGGVKAPPAAITAAKAKLARLYTQAGISKADADWDVNVPIWKANDGAGDDPMIVYGVVLHPGVTDSQGDVVSAAEIEKACHEYMLESRMIDLQHNEIQEQGAGVVECYIAPSDMVVAGKPVLKGSWVMATAITDPVRKADVREGRLTGYSIGGSAVRI